MKPISLTFTGINSYEEEFFIDFETLADGGIFGIFGPTGSGKSTILDAITLALYGEIPRYTKTSHSTFINSAGTTAHVVFRFQIQRDALRQYEVKRSYKRDAKGKGARIANCQLSEIGGEILADRKEAQVTAAVIGLIGLNYHDFTRSVFLPQGKFNEFIFLKGDERSKMLERLFDLEELGKVLINKVRNAERTTEAKLETCAMQMAFYGDITKDLLEEKTKSCVALSGEIERLSLSRELFFDQREIYKNLEAAYTQLQVSQNKLSQLLVLQNDIDTDKTTLEAARRADKLHLPIEALKSLRKQYLQSKEQYGLAELLAQQTAQKTAQYDTEYQVARKAMDEEYPLLLKQEQALNGNLTVLDGIATIEKELAHLRLDWKQQNGKLEQMCRESDEGAKKDGEIDAALEKVVRTENELIVLPGVFKSLHAAATAEEELARKTKEYTIAEKKKLTLETRNETLSELYATSKHNLAAELAKDLKYGCECPVCGSKDHPNPAAQQTIYAQEAHSTDDFETLKTEYTQNQVLISNLSESLHQLTTDKNNLNTTLGAFRADLSLQTTFAAALQAAYDKNAEKSTLEKQELQLREDKEGVAAAKKALDSQISALEAQLGATLAAGEEKAAVIATNRAALGEYDNFDKISRALEDIKKRITAITTTVRVLEDAKNKCQVQAQEAATALASAQERLRYLAESLKQQGALIEQELAASGFDTFEAAEGALLSRQQTTDLDNKIQHFYQTKNELERTIEQLAHHLRDEEDLEQIPAKSAQALADYTATDVALTANQKAQAVLEDEIKKMTENLAALALLHKEQKALQTRHGAIREIADLFRANAFIKFLASRHLHYITTEATARLKRMTGGQYAIEYDEDTNFLIRDDFGGGAYRPPASLSGGEAFMASLCLALALATKIQMKSRADLSFFFLDEGFGSLDTQTLDIVVDCLEQLREENMVVGLITHVEELKNRITHKIELESRR